MPKLILTLDTETGLVDGENQSEEVFTINGNAQAYMRGDEKVITGWQIYVEMGKTTQTEERSRCGLGVIKWRDRQKEALRQAGDDIDQGARARLEGAIAMADQILAEIGFEEE
jgi:hypothetical protein